MCCSKCIRKAVQQRIDEGYRFVKCDDCQEEDMFGPNESVEKFCRCSDPTFRSSSINFKKCEEYHSFLKLSEIACGFCHAGKDCPSPYDEFRERINKPVTYKKCEINVYDVTQGNEMRPFFSNCAEEKVDVINITLECIELNHEWPYLYDTVLLQLYDNHIEIYSVSKGSKYSMTIFSYCDDDMIIALCIMIELIVRKFIDILYDGNKLQTVCDFFEHTYPYYAHAPYDERGKFTLDYHHLYKFYEKNGDRKIINEILVDRDCYLE